jgi:hypothetical protein
VDWSGSEYSPVVGSCELSSEPMGSLIENLLACWPTLTFSRSWKAMVTKHLLVWKQTVLLFQCY